MSKRKLANDSFGLKNNKSAVVPKSNLCFLMPSSMIISPTTKRPFSAMDEKIRHLTVEEIREEYWGKSRNKVNSLISLLNFRPTMRIKF